MVDHELCEVVRGASFGASFRKWTLRADNNNHHHGVVNISETPLYLELSWRLTATDPVKRVGIFRLDLDGLLRNGFIRNEPVGSKGPDVRLRIVRAEGHFFIQVNPSGPRLMMV